MTTILVVDDDASVVQLITHHLKQENFSVFTAANGMEALESFKTKPIDLAIIDVMMPYVDGFSLTKEIRKQLDIPIILLTAKDQLMDKEQGFRAGTDDYVVKPFEMKELLFRVQALLRRYTSSEDEEIVRIGQTYMDRASYELTIGSDTLLLPLKEFELLYFLMSNKERVFSRSQLIEHIWGIDFSGDERTVDVHIKRLRERLSPLTTDFAIRTIRGVGYSLEVTV